MDALSRYRTSFVAALAAAGIAALAALYVWNPQDVSWFPRCPFLALTGWKCPGCGTLRGIHALLHLRFADAVRLNAFMVAMIPVLAVMLASRRFRFSPVVAWTVFACTVVWWIARNIAF